MSTKHLLTMSLLLPLVAVSATAQAGSTITDKSYWPNESRQSRPDRSCLANRSVFCIRLRSGNVTPAPMTAGGGSAFRYQGGPKGR